MMYYCNKNNKNCVNIMFLFSELEWFYFVSYTQTQFGWMGKYGFGLLGQCLKAMIIINK